MHRSLRLVALMLVFAVLLLGGLLIFPLATRSAPPPPWHVELEHYLAYRSEHGPETPDVLAAVQATRPWLFTARQSQAVFQANAFDPNDHNYSQSLASPSTIPFPPADLWCVLLGREGPPGVRQVVYVAEHESLYLGYWVVHEGPTGPFSPQLSADLDQIGCVLPLGR
jgi:hypothetical protein